MENYSSAANRTDAAYLSQGLFTQPRAPFRMMDRNGTPSRLSAACDRVANSSVEPFRSSGMAYASTWGMSTSREPATIPRVSPAFIRTPSFPKIESFTATGRGLLVMPKT